MSSCEAQGNPNRDKPNSKPKSANSKNIDASDIQFMHQTSYNNLNEAFKLVQAAALDYSSMSISVNLIIGQMDTVKNQSGLGMYRGFAAGTTTTTQYAYDSAWTRTTGQGTLPYFQDFFAFALSRISPVQGSSEPTVTCQVGGEEYQTYYDFHVARLAQLVMGKVMFCLCMTATTYAISSASSKDNLMIIGEIITNIEDDLSGPIYDESSDSTDLQNPENIYMTIKSLSSKNLTDSQKVAALQEAIDARRRSLQTALNAEMQIDRIKWWARFTMWMWIAIFVLGVFLIVVAVISESYLLIYITFAIIVTAQILSWIMHYFGYNSSFFDISGIHDNIALTLGNSGLHF